MNQMNFQMLMNSNKYNDVILASQSPRRKILLKRIFPEFRIIKSNVEETFPEDRPKGEVSLYLAEKKAENIAKNFPNSLIIACDTSVILEEHIFGKPANREEAENMLRMLSGKTQKVVSGVCCILGEKRIRLNSVSYVTFYDISDDEISAYCQTDEPYDKAGAYAVQGLASKFIKNIDGSFDSIVGLPVAEIYQELKKEQLL